LGAFSSSHLPPYPVDVPTGVQFALEPIDGGFLVSDGHHNRILQVTLGGEITELISFGNVVPTGLAVSDDTVYMTEIGAIPHVPADGKVTSFELNAPRTENVASGVSMVVDVEFGPGGDLYALSQGDSPGEVAPASPAAPTSGKLLRVNNDGTFTVLVDALDLPTTLEFAGDTALIVTLNGEVWRISDVTALQPGTGVTVSPPSAGDGGLADDRASSLTTLVVIAGVALGATALAWRRRFARP
jgi:hypothetical protein